MSYYDYSLETGDTYRNRYTRVRLPHDSDVKDPDKLAELSGPVVPYQLGEVREDEEMA